VLFDRWSMLVVGALGAVGLILLLTVGPPSLLAYVPLWALALPWTLRQVRGVVRAELAGVLFVLFAAAFADNLDDFLGDRQLATMTMVLLSFIYIAQRWRDARAVMRSPIVVAVAIFLTQAVISGFCMGNDDPLQIAENRIGVVASLVAGAVLVRRTASVGLFPALLILSALVSLPIMVYEITHVDVFMFSFSGNAGTFRAGGLFGQSNGVGCALSFALASLLALRTIELVPQLASRVLGGLLLFGVLMCASRGALVVFLALLAVATWVVLYRRAGRAPIVSSLLIAATLALTLPPLGRAAVAATEHLEGLGFESIDRLNEVVLAATGSTDDLVDDDSGRLKIAIEALQLIAERPVFGFGTHNFTVRLRHEKRSHVQFLEVLGENGIVGMVFYVGVLIAIGYGVARAPNRYRAGCAFVFLAWLLNHFDNHTIAEYRSQMLPVALIAGCGRLRDDG
jgi:O-antigen ligase